MRFLHIHSGALADHEWATRDILWFRKPTSASRSALTRRPPNQARPENSRAILETATDASVNLRRSAGGSGFIIRPRQFRLAPWSEQFFPFLGGLIILLPRNRISLPRPLMDILPPETTSEPAP